MAQHHLGNEQRAREAMNEGLKVAAVQLADPNNLNIGPDWLDWILAQRLMDEARQLLDTNPETLGEASGEKKSTHLFD